MSYFRSDLKKKAAVKVDVPHKKIMMCLNESVLNPLTDIQDKFIQNLSEVPLNRYFNPITQKLQKDLADYVGIPPEYLIFGNGADDILYSIFLAVRENNDSFAVSLAPSYFDYKTYSGAVGLGIKFLSLQQNFDFSLEEYLKLCHHPDCKLAILCQPNNPTGNLFEEEKLLTIIKTLPCLVLVDETYFEFSEQTFLPFLQKCSNLIIVRSFSKAFSAAGLRFGYAVSNPDNIRELKKVFTAFQVSLLSQTLAATILDNREIFEQHTKKVIQFRNSLYEEMQAIPEISVLNTATNFLLFSIGERTLPLFNYLSEHEIAVRNIGAHAVLQNFLRVTISSKEDNNCFIKNVKAFLGGNHEK